MFEGPIPMRSDLICGFSDICGDTITKCGYCGKQPFTNRPMLEHSAFSCNEHSLPKAAEERVAVVDAYFSGSLNRCLKEAGHLSPRFRFIHYCGAVMNTLIYQSPNR